MITALSYRGDGHKRSIYISVTISKNSLPFLRQNTTYMFTPRNSDSVVELPLCGHPSIVYWNSSLVPRLHPASSDGKLGGAWEQG